MRKKESQLVAAAPVGGGTVTRPNVTGMRNYQLSSS